MVRRKWLAGAALVLFGLLVLAFVKLGLLDMVFTWFRVCNFTTLHSWTSVAHAQRF